LIARDPEALILAVDDDTDDTVVGSIIVGWDGWRCHLYRLAVAPTHRRQGIGRELVARAEARFTSYGGTRADAMVLDDNAQAHRVWANAGYALQPEWSRLRAGPPPGWSRSRSPDIRTVRLRSRSPACARLRSSKAPRCCLRRSRWRR